MSEAVVPPATIASLLGAAGDSVLIGGQALAFWAARFGVPPPAGVAVITSDVDFLTERPTDRERVEAFAAVLNGKSHFPGRHARTALVGQAYLDVSDAEIVNVDVLFKVFGITASEIRRKAYRVEMADTAFLVMHPLHVLESRLLNLYELPEKQTDKGVMQLQLAVDVSRAFLRDELERTPRPLAASGRSPVQGLVSAIEHMAVEDAGRKVAERHGVHVADAIDPSLIPAGPFWIRRWPGLKKLMSAAYAERFAPPRPSGGRPRRAT
jgi:hypothetical protein